MDTKIPCSGASSTALGTWESAGRSISRVPGMAVFISESATGLPAGFVSMLRSVGVVHTAVVFLAVQRVCLPLSHHVTFMHRGPVWIQKPDRRRQGAAWLNTSLSDRPCCAADDTANLP